MKQQETEPDPAVTGQRVAAFYDTYPYPPPPQDLHDYRRRWQSAPRRRADFHLHWPCRPFREDLSVLVAGCGTSQAVKHALRSPESRVVGIDISATSLEHAGKLKQQYKLANLELRRLSVERAGELGARFDKVVCTGVLHHLADPESGLQALRDVVAPGGVLHLMAYATYGRMGIYMLQDYCRRLGITPTTPEIDDLAQTLTALPQDHPLARLLGQSPDFRSRAGLADALLHPQDRAYTVPQLFALLDGAGLTFSRWLRQAPYLPTCGAVAATPHASHLAHLPPAEQYAALELFRGTMLRHTLIAFPAGELEERPALRFDDDHMLRYVPIRLPDTVVVQERLPAGAAAVLINRRHTDTDLYLPLTPDEKQLFQAVDGRRSVAQIIDTVPAAPTANSRPAAAACDLFRRLWEYDQVVFDASAAAAGATT